MRAEVETRYGRIRGEEVAGIRIFRGVRYAAAPSGPRRFLPPASPEPWTGTRDATRAGAAAPQAGIPGLRWLRPPGRHHDEDCLSLNVWTPGLDGERRPVLVWIHGGGFLIGSGATPIYDGRDLARRGDVVVVTINYRLGALGYAHLSQIFGGEFPESSNLGVRDQIAALEWVRDNIERFGGDPSNVVVFGQSAGAMSIGALLASPRARELFRGAICQSGAGEHVLDPAAARLVARVFIEALGGPPANPEALGRIPVQRILRAQSATMSRLSNWHKLMAFLPAVDGDVIPEQPLDAVRRGALADKPLLIGATLDEWKLFELIEQGPRGMTEAELERRFEEVLQGTGGPPAESAVGEFRAALDERGSEKSSGDVWTAFQSSRVFHGPAWRLLEAQTAGGGEAYAYLFTWRAPALLGRLGACHAIDLPFVFGLARHPLAVPFMGFSESAARLSRAMQEAWIRLARAGRPGHEALPDWQPYEPRRRSTMILGRDCALQEAPLETERRLLERWTGIPSPA